MPQARGSSAGVWAQFGGCVGRNLGCLSIPEHPHTAPLSQAESSAPGKPIHPEREGKNWEDRAGDIQAVGFTVNLSF